MVGRVRRGSWKGALLGTAISAFALGFVTLTISVSVGPLTDWTQELGSCLGADQVKRTETAGGTVRARNRAVGNYSDQSTTTFELACRYGEDVRRVGNDEAVVRGFLVGFLFGALPGALLFLAWRARRPSTPAAAG